MRKSYTIINQFLVTTICTLYFTIQLDFHIPGSIDGLMATNEDLKKYKLINTLRKQLKDAEEAVTKAKLAINAVRNTLDVFCDICDQFEGLGSGKYSSDTSPDSDSSNETN